jgi:hypothetical protein
LHLVEVSFGDLNFEIRVNVRVCWEVFKGLECHGSESSANVGGHRGGDQRGCWDQEISTTIMKFSDLLRRLQNYEYLRYRRS